MIFYQIKAKVLFTFELQIFITSKNINMKTIKFFILALTLIVGTNLSAECYENKCPYMETVPEEKSSAESFENKCFDMAIASVQEPPAGYECYEISITFLPNMTSGEYVIVSDAGKNFKKLHKSTTFTWCYLINPNSFYNRTISCDTYIPNGCEQHDGCIVIVDGDFTIP